MKPAKTSGDIFIVDNSDVEWKVAQYLREWTDYARQFDIATGYFEIGSLLALDGQWQKLDHIRILMGDEVSYRTKRAFAEGLQKATQRLDASLESEKTQNDFLIGVPAIVEAIRSGKIECRVYRRDKFHAKCYLTHGRSAVIGSFALVGSSNFTYPGLVDNIELNVQIRGNDVQLLQAWYERHWEEAEDVTPEILRVIERHTRDYSPFELYAKALAEYFRSHGLSAGEWEKSQSVIYPILSQYQREGYQALIEIARRYNGALLCDGVGLGKTFIGLMVIERLLFERKNVALIVPKAAREDVWEAKLRQFLPRALRQTSNLFIYNHTDLLRGGSFRQYMEEIKEDFDALVIDEAHHFRNLSSQRSQKLFELAEQKQLFLLTATPINNSLYDLMHLIEYFSRRRPDYFRDRPGIHTLRGHFRQMEAAIDALLNNGGQTAEIDTLAANEILSRDDLFQELVVQRSRAYVKRSLAQDNDHEVAFPTRQDPQVASYSLADTYGRLLHLLETAFHKGEPLLTLGIYNPVRYLLNAAEQEAVDEFEKGRLGQVVALIRTLLLKRFESSAVAFEASCEDLLLKLLYFVRLHNPKTAERWERQHATLMERIHNHKQQLGLPAADDEEALDEDIIPETFKRKIEKLDGRKYNVAEMVLDSLLDMDELAKFLRELADFDPARDDKLQTLIRLLQTGPLLQQQKVLIFTEFIHTARYLQGQLSAAGIGPLAEVDSLSSNRSDIIHAFAPYYNGRSPADLAAQNLTETRVLIATDVLSEGLNLQDAACVINYDLHWNPVRLMQRIGRVDRRLDPQIEAQMVAERPFTAHVRGTVHLWNFLPPQELNRILSLYERVTHKTLRISKTFGIEGRKLLTPEDDYEALREFNHAYEGQTTSLEEMRLAYQELLRAYPDLETRLNHMPRRIFSGKQHPQPGTRALFFCYLLPARDAATGDWMEEAGFTRWYLLDLANDEISEDAVRIFPIIRATPETPRQTRLPQPDLTALRQQMDRHVTNTYLKKVDAPLNVTARLIAWLELI